MDAREEKIRSSVFMSDMLDRIKSTTYTLMDDGRTTFCCLEMVNGYSVWGKSACVDPANYNQALGEKYSFDDAINQLWPLEGYLLAEQRYQFNKK